MANWSTTTKHEPSSINNGRRYELRDRVSIEQLNNMTENSFYAMEASSVAKEKAEEALKFAQGSGTTVYENGSPVAEFNADKKVDKSELQENYYNKSQVDEIIANNSTNVDLSNYYTKQETYSKQEIDDKLANLDVDIDFTDYYTKDETNDLLNAKANQSSLNTTNLKVSNLETSFSSVASNLETVQRVKADKTDLKSLATKEELNSYAKKDEVLTEDDLKDYATESEIQGWISSESSSLREDINKKVDASALEGLEESINQVSNNLTGISQKYVQDAAVSTDGKTLQIVKKVGNEIKNVYFQGGGGTNVIWREWT